MDSSEKDEVLHTQAFRFDSVSLSSGISNSMGYLKQK